MARKTATRKKTEVTRKTEAAMLEDLGAAMMIKDRMIKVRRRTRRVKRSRTTRTRTKMRKRTRTRMILIKI